MLKEEIFYSESSEDEIEKEPTNNKKVEKSRPVKKVKNMTKKSSLED
jgi:hypothetical protein